MRNKNHYKHKVLWKKRTLKKRSLHQYIDPKKFDEKFAKELFDFYFSIYGRSCSRCYDDYNYLGIKKKRNLLKKVITKEVEEEILNFYFS